MPVSAVKRSESAPNLLNLASPAANPPQQGPVDLFLKDDSAKLNTFRQQLKTTADARLITDAIMTCLTPFRRVNGPIELQIAVLLMAIMRKQDNQRKSDGIEQARLEDLKAGLKSKTVIAQLEKVESQLKSEHQARAEQISRESEGLSSVVRMQNEALTASLREMRGA